METTLFWLRRRYSRSRNSRALELDLGRAAPDFAREEVHLQVAEGEVGDDGGGAAAADEGLEAREQLGEGERLGQVVVAAALQAGDTVVERALGAEDEDGDLDALGAPALDDAEAVELGQHEVDDGGVERGGAAHLAAFLAVDADVDGVAGFAQTLGDKGGDLCVIFEKENFHNITVTDVGSGTLSAALQKAHVCTCVYDAICRSGGAVLAICAKSPVPKIDPPAGNATFLRRFSSGGVKRAAGPILFWHVVCLDGKN